MRYIFDNDIYYLNLVQMKFYNCDYKYFLKK